MRWSSPKSLISASVRTTLTGTSIVPVAEPSGTGSTRLGSQRLLPGSGRNAGSPTADQINRPAGSVNPATGFQAAVGRPAVPTASQPFQGKSFSLTVLTNMA